MMEKTDIIAVTETFLDTVSIDIRSEYNIDGLKFLLHYCTIRGIVA